MDSIEKDDKVISIIMAAGRGSRMKGYDGNKTLLPLAPDASIFEGDCPICMYLAQNLPSGPKALIVNHGKETVIAATQSIGAEYCEQPRLNGTGGAILAAGDFLAAQRAKRVIITMGDVPFVKQATFASLTEGLGTHDLMILGFTPNDKKQYGVLEIEDGRVHKITEWKYWKEYPVERRNSLKICNSGIYAVNRSILVAYLPILASRPQVVRKEVNGKMKEIQEFFLTDLVELMVQDGRRVGFHVVEDEIETMGVDDVDALKKAQGIYAEINRK